MGDDRYRAALLALRRRHLLRHRRCEEEVAPCMGAFHPLSVESILQTSPSVEENLQAPLIKQSLQAPSKNASFHTAPKLASFDSTSSLAKPSYNYENNDYLGLRYDASSARLAFEAVERYNAFSSSSSMLLGGYHALHREFEALLAASYDAHSALLVGSGFLGNLAIFDTLLASGDTLYIDEFYHASGNFILHDLESRGVGVVRFTHNDAEALEELIKTDIENNQAFELDSTPKPDSTLQSKSTKLDSTLQSNSTPKIDSTKPKGANIFIAIEGVYSMDGDIGGRGFYDLALRYDAYLIVDEAHSIGTIGGRLLGYFDYHGVAFTEHCIKLGTLSKALASYGGYIISSRSIHDFLLNRAKSVIYTTALSLFDTALAYEHFSYLLQNHAELKERYARGYALCREILGIGLLTPLLIIKVSSSKEALLIKERLALQGFYIGAIRYPTAPSPRLRIALHLGYDEGITRRLLELLSDALAM